MKMLFYWLIIHYNIISMVDIDQSTIIEAPEVYKSIPTHSLSKNDEDKMYLKKCWLWHLQWTCYGQFYWTKLSWYHIHTKYCKFDHSEMIFGPFEKMTFFGEHPLRRQVVNASGATRSADAIFEVKKYNFCPTRYNHNNQNINPANRRARDIVNQYNCKVRNLDVMFAASVVVDGNNNVIGPFKNALSQFHGKTIIPLCFSAFGEVNEDLDKVIQCLMFSKRSSIIRWGTHNLTTCQHG